MLYFAGLSHKSAPLDLRERCAVSPDERERAQAELSRALGHVVLLSTCGRTELYVDHPDPDAAEGEAVRWLAARAGADVRRIAAHLETARGEDAVCRAIRVACGLESAVEGEDEILGQVRRAWLDAGSAGALSPSLDALFRLAVRTGRQARRIGDPDAWTSLADTAAAHVALAVERRPCPRVLIAGSGPMGLRSARSLRERFGADLGLTLAGRTMERVVEHAGRLDAHPMSLDGIPEALASADGAIVGLRTRRTLIGPEHVAPRPAGRPLLIVDLSVPRAVKDAVGGIPGVALRNVDDLGGGEGTNGRWDAEGRSRVEALVAAARQEFVARTERSDAAETLAALRSRADGIRRAQLARTLRRLPHLDDETRWTIDALTRAIVNRVLHEPTLRLRADANGEVARQVRSIFFE